MADQKTWTPEEIDRLCRAFAAGTSRADIARDLDRSVGSVRAKILSLGLRRGVRPWTAREKGLMRSLYEDGLPINEIARRLNRSADAVTRMCNRLDLRRGSPATPWTEEQVAALTRMLEAGHSLARIARAIGHPRSSIADKLRQLNLKSPRFRQPWTAEERRTLLRLHGAGATSEEIAAALPGRSPVAIRLKLADLTSQPAAVAVRPPARRTVSIPASLAEMERWLRSRDYMVLHQGGGWVVDRHVLADEAAFIEFVNVRRARLNLPPFRKGDDAHLRPPAGRPTLLVSAPAA